MYCIYIILKTIKFNTGEVKFSASVPTSGIVVENIAVGNLSPLDLIPSFLAPNLYEPRWFSSTSTECPTLSVHGSCRCLRMKSKSVAVGRALNRTSLLRVIGEPSNQRHKTLYKFQNRFQTSTLFGFTQQISHNYPPIPSSSFCICLSEHIHMLSLAVSVNCRHCPARHSTFTLTMGLCARSKNQTTLLTGKA